MIKSECVLWVRGGRRRERFKLDEYNLNGVERAKTLRYLLEAVKSVTWDCFFSFTWGCEGIRNKTE